MRPMRTGGSIAGRRETQHAAAPVWLRAFIAPLRSRIANDEVGRDFDCRRGVVGDDAVDAVHDEFCGQSADFMRFLRIVVSGGFIVAAKSRSAKPTTERSSRNLHAEFAGGLIDELRLRGRKRRRRPWGELSVSNSRATSRPLLPCGLSRQLFTWRIWAAADCFFETNCGA